MALLKEVELMRNWYEQGLYGSLELIESFVSGIEKQAIESIKNYEQNKETIILHEPDDGSFIYTIDVHQGLTDQTWDLNIIFNEYFPSLQRSSALLTVCGYFEHELNKLCILYQKEYSYQLSPADLNGKGIDRSINYLEKVVGLDSQKSSDEWSQIKSIQKIRNLLVHQSGKLHNQKGNLSQEVINYIHKIDSLKKGRTEIIINEGFLAHVVSIYKGYLDLLSKKNQDETR